MSRARLAILFGGASSEHEVSIRSATSVLAAVDRERFERELTSYGPRLAIITEGGRGVRYVAETDLPDDPMRWREAERESGQRQRHLPIPGGRLPGDPTGRDS